MMRAGGGGLGSSMMRSGSSSLRHYTVYGPLQPVTLPHSPAVRGCVVLSSSPSPGASSDVAATTTPPPTYECPHLFVRRVSTKSKRTHTVINPTAIKIEQTCEICGRDRDLHILNDGYDDAAHDDSIMIPFHEIRYNHRLSPRACSRRRITDNDAPATPIGGSPYSSSTTTDADANASSPTPKAAACLNTPPPLYNTFDEEHHRAAGWLPGIRNFRSLMDLLGLTPYFFASTASTKGGVRSKGEVSAYEAVPFWLVRNTYRLIDQFNLHNVRMCPQPSFCPVGEVKGVNGGSGRAMPYCEAFPPSKEAVAQNRIMRNSDCTKLPAYLFPVLGTWPFFLRTLARVRTVDRVNNQLFDRRRAILRQILGTTATTTSATATSSTTADTSTTLPAPTSTGTTTSTVSTPSPLDGVGCGVDTDRVAEVDALLREGLMAVRAAGGAFGSPYEHAFYGSPSLVARMRVMPSFFRADYESNLTSLVRMVSTFPHATTTPSSAPNGRLKVRTNSTPDGDGIRILLVSFSHAPFTPSFVLYADDNLKQLVLTFRGTHSDANAVTDVHNEGMVVGYGKVGRGPPTGESKPAEDGSSAASSSFIVPLVVARGFYCLVAPTASTIMHELDTVLHKEMAARGMLDPATANTFGYKLIVTGHSLGGGQALTYAISRLCLDKQQHDATSAGASTTPSMGGEYAATPYLQSCEEWSCTGVQDTGLQNPSNNITFPLLFTPEMLRSGLVQVHAFSPPPVVNGPLRDIINRHVSTHRADKKLTTTPLCSYVFEDDLVPRTAAQSIKEYTDAVHASSIAAGPSTSSPPDLSPESIFGVGGSAWEVKWKAAQQQLQGNTPATSVHSESELWEDPAIRRYLTRYYVPGDVALLTRDLDSTAAEQASNKSTSATSIRERQLRTTAHCFYYDAGSTYFPSPAPVTSEQRGEDVENDVDAGGAPLGLPALVGVKGTTDHLLLNYHRAMLSVVKKSPF